MKSGTRKARLIIFPQGGLGNRIRTISSGIQLAKTLPMKLYVCWLRDEGLNCDYEQIFEKNEDFELINFEKNTIFFFKVMNKLYTKIPKLLNLTGLLPNHYFNINTNNKLSFRQKDIVIWTCGKFYEYQKIDLHFNKALTDQASLVYDQFNEKTYGIHIRLTDNTVAIQHSPPLLFENKIAEIIKVEEGAKFFLCTDDTDIKDHFSKRFGDAIITRNVNLSRNATKGIMDAAIDMLCLSKTKKIYSSFNSSFSGIAAEFSSIERVELKNQV